MSKKHFNEAALENELQGSAFFKAPQAPPALVQVAPSTWTRTKPAALENAPAPTADPAGTVDASEPLSAPTAASAATPSQPTTEPIGQSVDQSTGWPTIDSPEPVSGEVVERPKAFYITKRLDRRLDQAVRYLEEARGIKKVDRSTVVNAMLDSQEHFTDESLDTLASRVVSQLTSRLTS